MNATSAEATRNAGSTDAITRISFAFCQDDSNPITNRLTRIATAAVIVMRRPANLFAAYQTVGDERVFCVLKPYQWFGGTRPKSNGILTKATTAGAANAIRNLIVSSLPIIAFRVRGSSQKRGKSFLFLLFSRRGA